MTLRPNLSLNPDGSSVAPLFRSAVGRKLNEPACEQLKIVIAIVAPSEMRYWLVFAVLLVALGACQTESTHMPLDEAAANVFADKVSGVLGAFRADGLSQRAMVVQLNALGIGAPNVANWSLLQSSE